MSSKGKTRTVRKTTKDTPVPIDRFHPFRSWTCERYVRTDRVIPTISQTLFSGGIINGF